MANGISFDERTYADEVERIPWRSVMSLEEK